MKNTITFKIDEELNHLLDFVCKGEQTTKSQFIRNLINIALTNRDLILSHTEILTLNPAYQVLEKNKKKEVLDTMTKFVKAEYKKLS